MVSKALDLDLGKYPFTITYTYSVLPKKHNIMLTVPMKKINEDTLINVGSNLYLETSTTPSCRGPRALSTNILKSMFS